MRTLTAGPICSGLECAPLYVLFFIVHYAPFILLALLAILAVAYFKLRSKGAKKTIIVFAIAAIAFFAMIAGLQIWRDADYVRHQQEVAAGFKFQPYEVTKEPQLLQNIEPHIHTFSTAKYFNKETFQTEVKEGPEYSHLIYDYSKEQGALGYMLVQFSKKDINPEDEDCGTYDPEFPSDKAEGGCLLIGQNSLGKPVYKAKEVLSEVVYMTDMKNTRVSFFYSTSLPAIPDNEVVEMLGSLNAVEAQNIPFSKPW